MVIHQLRVLVFIAAIVLAPAALLAHGITRTIEEGKSMVVTAYYDDGKPISYASVKVFAPGKKETEYQNGRTDKNGRFAFVPSEAGDWLVRLDDGTGHGFEEHVKVDADMGGKASSPVLVKLGQKVIVFLLLAWGGVMTALYVRKAGSG
ncbi:MAG TPA: hypothetical protein PLM53_17850 [Spirochaetota bacterium]|nr:hypothetical protein [Spirochaetota bacterium]HPC42533.1 hypothetical protein [Spirochaetota bacterium]HPL15487.1 hypothetical protein [Spirochaetota bacterium]HQF10179.1 hypothetical protein [Spirochaetota bacterium]HQH98963.1 hypothetical protein [Spirochaetota bacterium]